MRISFVIPAYNEREMLPIMLASLAREAGAHPNIVFGENAEVVVVDNASTDGTGDVARSFPFVKVVHEPKKGLVQARHTGFNNSTGELVANIDADVVVPKGWLTKVLKEFEKDPKLVALSGPYIYYDLPALTRGLVKAWYAPGWIFHTLTQPILKRATMFQGGNFVIRRDAWEAAGGFDTSIAFYGEDADVARRISKFGKVKWTWGLPMYTSGRRLRHEGVFTTAFNYGLNLLATHLTGRPYSKEYKDIRQ